MFLFYKEIHIMKETSVIHQILNTPMITPIINLTESLTYFCMLFLHVLVWGERLRFTYVENRIPYMIKKKKANHKASRLKILYILNALLYFLH